MVEEVELIVNGENVPLNNFASGVFKNVNFAIVETLKGIDEKVETITLKIKL